MAAATPSAEPAARARAATSATGKGKDFAAELEKLVPVKGHGFRKVVGGDDDGRYVNRSGNERDGQRFDRVWRDGRCFHVYGAGEDRKVLEVTPKAKTEGTTGGTQASAKAGGTPAAS